MTLEVKLLRKKQEPVLITFKDPLAKIMEYGTVTVPATPFLRPAIEDVKSDVPNLIRKGGLQAVAEAIVEAARFRLKVLGKEKVGEKVEISGAD